MALLYAAKGLAYLYEENMLPAQEPVQSDRWDNGTFS